MRAEVLLEQLADLLAPKLVERGFVTTPDRTPRVRPSDSRAYNKATCTAFVDPAHIGDRVLERARFFFGELASKGEIVSVDLARGLDLKGPRSIPANLTIPLKKSAWRLGFEEPWEAEVSGPRTIWRDRGGIAGRMVNAIEKERALRIERGRYEP
jgi:hypothetical protein